MNSEMNHFTARALLQAAPPRPAALDGIVLDGEELAAMRRGLHELANVFTGMALAGGLLRERLQGTELRRYAADICADGERGRALIAELRRVLLYGGFFRDGEAGAAVEEPFSEDFL